VSFSKLNNDLASPASVHLLTPTTPARNSPSSKARINTLIHTDQPGLMWETAFTSQHRQFFLEAIC